MRPQAPLAGVPAGGDTGVPEAPAGVPRTGGRPLDRLGPLTPLEMAGITAALATGLADLHDVGRAHGAVAAERVVVRADGTPVLRAAPMSEGAARSASDRGTSERGTSDRGTSERGTDEPAPADDVAALGVLVTWMLDRAGVPAPHRRRRARRRSGRPVQPFAGPAPRRRRAALWAPGPDDVLADLARRCQHPDATRRPTARAVATAVRTGVPAARLPDMARNHGLVIWPRAVVDGTARPSAGGRGHWRRRWRGRSAAVLVAGVLALVAFGPWARPTERAGAKPSSDQRPRGGQAPPPEAPGMTAVTAVAGVLSVGGVRYAVGDHDDLAVLADLGCGDATVVVLRRPTGELFAFDDLPHDATPTTGRLVRTVPDAVALTTTQDEEGCAGLRVERSGGSHEVVSLAPAVEKGGSR